MPPGSPTAAHDAARRIRCLLDLRDLLGLLPHAGGDGVARVPAGGEGDGGADFLLQLLVDTLLCGVTTARVAYCTLAFGSEKRTKSRPVMMAVNSPTRISIAETAWA